MQYSVPSIKNGPSQGKRWINLRGHMPTRRRISLLTLVATVAVSVAYAQKLAPKPQESFAPYWTSEPGWDTELQLKNNLASVP